MIRNYSNRRRFDEIKGSERMLSVGVETYGRSTSMQLQNVNEASILRIPTITITQNKVEVLSDG